MSKEIYQTQKKHERLSEIRSGVLGKIALNATEAAAYATIASNYSAHRAGNLASRAGKKTFKASESVSKKAKNRLIKSQEKIKSKETDKTPAFIKKVGSLAIKGASVSERISSNLQVKMDRKIESTDVKHKGTFWKRNKVSSASNKFVGKRHSERVANKDTRAKIKNLANNRLENVNNIVRLINPNPTVTSIKPEAKEVYKPIKLKSRDQIRSEMSSAQLKKQSIYEAIQIKNNRDRRGMGTPVAEVAGLMSDDVDRFINDDRVRSSDQIVDINGSRRDRLPHSFGYPVGYSQDPNEHSIVNPGEIPAQDVYLCSDYTFRKYDSKNDQWTSLSLGGENKDEPILYLGEYLQDPSRGGEMRFYDLDLNQQLDSMRVAA